MDRRLFIRNLALASAGFLLSGADIFAKTITHKVAYGDTLSALAVKYGISVSTLKRVNGLKSDMIRSGQYLVIPVPASYRYIEHVVKQTQEIRLTPNRWRVVVTHHSGIDRGNAEAYGNYHKRRGMKNGLAYHFVIGNGLDSGDGQVEVGPRWLAQLDGGHVHTDKFNKIGIGICLVGNFEKRNPSRKQLEALYELTDFIKGNVRSRIARYAVHKEIDGARHTVCPGRNFPIKEYHRRLG